MSGRLADVAAVSALALALTVVMAAPVLRAPSERIFGEAIVGRHHDPFTVMEQFSRPFTLGVYSQPLTDIPGALIARASGPVAAYNWLVLVTFPLSAAAAYLLARYLALSHVGAAIAAIAFAFSPFHIAHAAYHPHIAQVQWVPLYFLALWRCLDAGTPAAVGLLAAAIGGVTLSNFYGGFIAAVATPAAIAAYWFFPAGDRPRSRSGLAITLGSLLLIAAGGIVYIWYAARAVVTDPAAFAFTRDNLFLFSAKWWSYFVPPVANPLVGGFAERVWNAAGVDVGMLEQQVSLGWGLVALAGVAVLAWRFRPRRQTSLAAVPVLAIVAAVALLCSLSPERRLGPFTITRPSAWLYRGLPMFRSYARFGVVVQLMMVMLAGIGAEWLWKRASAARIACVALLLLAAGEYAVWPLAMWRDVLPTKAHRWVVQQPDRLRVLDCAPLTPESESIQWLSGNRLSLEHGALDDCAEPNIADKLSAAGYTHLLVRRETSEGWWFASRQPSAGLRVAARFDDGDVFAVTAAKPSVYTVQMSGFYGREYDGAATWRWMGPEASWVITNRSGRPMVAAVDVDLSAFHGPRRLQIRLDGADVQELTIEDRSRPHRIGPLALAPGDHDLMFHPADPPTVADAVMNNGDRRPLSFGFGGWQWSVEGSQP
jgi:hypothetical protein